MDMDIELLALDRIPLPSLEMYTFLSLLAASTSMYYLLIEAQSQLSLFYNNSSQVNENSNTNAISYSQQNPFIANILSINATNTTLEPDNLYQFSWQNAIHWASQQPHCIWPLVNLAYCLLILLAHYIQRNVFGNLRASEQENIKDQFWNLVFYKVVFVFGVVNVQEVEDAVGWCFFVSVIGSLQLARQLCKDRHNYLIIMNDWSRDGEVRRRRIISLLCFILVISLGLFGGICVWYSHSSPKIEYEMLQGPGYSKPTQALPSSRPYDFNLGLHSTIFMLSEIGLLIIQSFHAVLVCILDQVYSKCRRYYLASENNENSTTGLVHAVNFRMDLVALVFDLAHHVHMVVCCNLFLSMTSLIVALQMRARVRQIHCILKKRESYIWLTQHINKYPDYSNFEKEPEDCAICWDNLCSKRSKQLPCNHVFHADCLRKWLLVSMNCPTCRLSLISETDLQKYPRGARMHYNTAPVGVFGFLQTGQTLLDLFGGWDPETDEIPVEEQSSPENVSRFPDFNVQDWAVQPQSTTTGSSATVEMQKND